MTEPQAPDGDPARRRGYDPAAMTNLTLRPAPMSGDAAPLSTVRAPAPARRGGTGALYALCAFFAWGFTDPTEENEHLVQVFDKFLRRVMRRNDDEWFSLFRPHFLAKAPKTEDA